ncbi:MAG: hypothetical protein HGA27_03020 [Peptococcaceae bacterium]|nr:hypothetical protein [Peptococcaceae bacterium]
MELVKRAAVKPDINKVSLESLVQEVLSCHVQPEDKYEIAAILESLGWTDSMAKDVFGVEDVFVLAESIWDSIKSGITFVPALSAAELSIFAYIVLILRSFLRGTIFALPMAVSVLSMLTLRYSLSSYEYLSLENATSIAIGTILSFVAVGGFTQAIARRGFMYVGQGHYSIARRVTFHLLKVGYVICLLAALLFLIFSVVFSVFPWNMTLISILYFLFLCAIWLSVTIMYILQKEIFFTGLFIGGIGVVFIFFTVIGLNIIISQVIALFAVSAVGIVAAQYFFIKAEKEMEKGIAPQLPRLSIIAFTSIPYFIYGFLYFSFLYADRIIAWSTNNLYMPYLIWFRGEYELGLDFALLTLILPMGLVEVVVNEFMMNLEANQKNHTMSDLRVLKEIYLRLYIKRGIFIMVFSVINSIGLYFILRILSLTGIMELNIFTTATTSFVFIWAIVSYTIFTIALLNALILFCFSQPELVYKPLVFSLLLNLVLGFMLSRWVDYSWAIFGLLVGTIVFTYLTTRAVFKLIKNLDYYLYSAS